MHNVQQVCLPSLCLFWGINILIFILKQPQEAICSHVDGTSIRKHFTVCDQSPQLSFKHSTWQLPEELCEQEGHQSLPNDHPTSQPPFSFMCHIQLTVRLVRSLSHSLNPSLCCSQCCRVAPFHLPWLLAMAIFHPGSLDPRW